MLIRCHSSYSPVGMIVGCLVSENEVRLGSHALHEQELDTNKCPKHRTLTLYGDLVTSAQNHIRVIDTPRHGKRMEFPEIADNIRHSDHILDVITVVIESKLDCGIQRDGKGIRSRCIFDPLYSYGVCAAPEFAGRIQRNYEVVLFVRSQESADVCP